MTFYKYLSVMSTITLFLKKHELVFLGIFLLVKVAQGVQVSKDGSDKMLNYDGLQSVTFSFQSLSFPYFSVCFLSIFEAVSPTLI